MTVTVAAVAIGRNEGDRLIRCLTTLKDQLDRIVYVDSGSSDGSVQAARDLGIEVVELDTTVPFTAARARNAGFEVLKPGGLPDFVQFVDGDCGVEPGWIESALTEFKDRPDLGVVTGWRSEIYPSSSIYNALADFEWHRPAGEIRACGGDMMVRSNMFDALDGFNPTVIAAEDDEFCTRVRKAGFRLTRLPLSMTRHDAAMTRFSQWWQRAVRSGHGFAQVGDLHPDYFVKERRRVVLYGGVLPLVALLSLAFTIPLVLIAVLAIYALSYLRTVRGLQREGLNSSMALHQSVYLSISKFPNLIGMARYHLRKIRGSAMRIIEYK
ncbi:mycofactocin system glycosyltransferase [Thalassovita gelatinovora]|uniref:Mycofactocin system glycosyltransferase n=1 Tax=Thalassovita gelatinovora TaxID=53501 RepID=A0A0P1FAD2_THAGE|nr:glycosyltransferase [Thalassovita gelatinovora]QIZ81176.1 glycosyltransferase family 2 protein [Thalassovita gelatinovora]CUH64772.1 mycofactocin system glycosyltransferase [Thalassovita gelatinovora]SEP92346.1 Glycosyltransferase, GT2 family [Thalassovita gelatinovora]